RFWAAGELSGKESLTARSNWRTQIAAFQVINPELKVDLGLAQYGYRIFAIGADSRLYLNRLSSYVAANTQSWEWDYVGTPKARLVGGPAAVADADNVYAFVVDEGGNLCVAQYNRWQGRNATWTWVNDPNLSTLPGGPVKLIGQPAATSLAYNTV